MPCRWLQAIDEACICRLVRRRRQVDEPLPDHNHHTAGSVENGASNGGPTSLAQVPATSVHRTPSRSSGLARDMVNSVPNPPSSHNGVGFI